MNHYRILVLLLLTGTTLLLQAQKGGPILPTAYIEPLRLEVSYNKTSHLIFPGPITSIDRGSQDILVGKAEGVDNILRVKAATKTFEETNLSVITRDGKLYSFLVCYNPNPPFLNVSVSLPGASPVKNTVLQTSRDALEQTAGTGKNRYVQQVLEATANLHRRANKAMMQAVLTGLFIKEQTFYFRLQLENRSAVPFDIDGLRFTLKDRKGARRTAAQEVELIPLTLHGDTSCIPAQSAATRVLELPAFTIPEGKYLKIEAREKSGGRQLSLRLHNRHILRASPLGMKQPDNQ